MGDVRLLIKRLGIRSQAPQIESKALEYLRKANAILGRNALGQVGKQYIDIYDLF